MRFVTPVVVLLIAAAIGWFLFGYDQRTDDAGIEAGLFLLSSLVLSFAAPRLAPVIALVIAGPTVLWDVKDGVYGALLILVFTGVGAAVGYVIRREARSLSRAG